MCCVDNYNTYWVTGASDGIGKAVVLLLAKHGKNLILSAKDASKLNALKQECETQSSLYTSKKATITIIDYNCNDITKTQEISTELAPSVDVAILCAGISQRARATEMEHKSDNYIYNVNFVSPATTVKCLTRAWAKESTTRKKILFVSSVAGHMPVPSRAMYGASKRALEHYCETVSNELVAPYSSAAISIVAVIPGFVNTHISAKAIKGNFEPWNKQDKNQLHGISVESAAKKIIHALNTNKVFSKKYIGMSGSLYVILLLYALLPKIANKILSRINVAT